MRVLLVEDDRSLADIIVTGMREQHLSVLVAGSVREGRERVQLGDFDVIVLDVMLPDGTGLPLRVDPRPRDHDADPHADGPRLGR